MKLTERDKILAMILPALIVGLVYGFFFLRVKVNEYHRIEKSLADAKAKAPSHLQLAAQRMEMTKLRQETDQLNEKLRSLQGKWTYETAFCNAGADRHTRLMKLTNLLHKHDLSATEDGEMDATAKMSASVDSVVKKIALHASEQKPQLRKIRFHGQFTNVHRVLEELAAGEVLAIPVGLTMKTTADPDRREWTLLIWL